MQEILRKAELLKKEYEKNHPDLGKVIKLGESLRKACQRIQRSWSGSFAGWHGSMYFKNYEVPSINERFSGEWGGIHGMPVGWEKREPEEVKKENERLVGNSFSIDEYEISTTKLIKSAEKLRDEISILFSAFPFNKEFDKEKELFSKIEKHVFGKRKDDHIKRNLPRSLVSRDLEAVRQGTYLASWLYFEGVALEGIGIVEEIEELMKMIDRLIRQIGGKMQAKRINNKIGNGLLSGMHPEIIIKCKSLYRDDTYAEAVEKSFKVVRDKLRKLTGHETGSDAFGRGKIHIKGAAAKNVDKDFNDAVKFLTMAIDQFRNEKSHTSDAKINDPNRAYEYMRLSSLAMNLLDQAEIIKDEDKDKS